MKTIRINKALAEKVAKDCGTTPEEYVAEIRSISLGRKVHARIVRQDGDDLIFACP